MTDKETSNKCSKIKTAVEFLADVHAKGYSETVLKKYLVEKRNLTAEEVEAAFMINANRVAQEKAAESEEMKSNKERSTGKSDRPEKSSFTTRDTVQDVNFLLPSKRAVGQKLINNFLDREMVYCNILNCLKWEYYVKLARFANQNKFEMSKKEVDEMFLRIPDLLKFHKKFFQDLKRGSNIGRMFVRLFKFFEGYAEYMKDCQQTVNKMRKYIRDTQLFSHMALIRHNSAQDDDMITLILTPLERLLEYRDFLCKLYGWTDRTQTSDFELLGKASRRIGRVATYIERYKFGICNQNEMNQVQKFLSDQCDILAPDRSIIRRGMMIRRTSGWTARNKRYVFFLFNDMLLWTTRNGTLQNAVQLRNCMAMPSSHKKNPQRKFEVVYRGEKHKTLWLECETLVERNKWYDAVRQAIAKAKENSSRAWSRNESLLNGSYKEYSEGDSGGEQKTGSGKDGDEDNKIEEEASDNLDNPYSQRYAVTSSFRMQEFKQIDPMDDNLSQISEQDVAFHQEHRQYTDSNIPTSAILSPFENTRDKRERRSDGRKTPVSIGNNQRRSRIPKREKVEDLNERSSASVDKHKKSNIIRSSSSSSSQPRTSPSSQFKLRLDNF